MFAKILKRKNKDGTTRSYLHIVKSVWKNGQSRHEKIANLGRVDELIANGTIDKLTEKFAELSDKLLLLNLNKNNNKIENSKEYGAILVYRKLWQELGYDKILKKYLSKTGKNPNLAEAILCMVANRLIAPGSKRKASSWINDVYDCQWNKLELQHFYRAMDFLEEHKEQFEKELFHNTLNLLNQEIDIVMFDTTSISTWGAGEYSNLLKHGHSKNHRNDLKQIIVGVLMTKDGVPIGHETWEGNQSDFKNFMQIINKVKTKYNIGKLVFVCDRGMISKKNIAELDKLGYEYIIGVRLRQLSEEKQNLLLSDTGFEEIYPNLFVKEKKIKFEYEDEEDNKREIEQRYVVCYNPKRAKEDARNREYFKLYLAKKIESNTMKDWIIKNGYKKYLKIEDDKIIIDIDEKRLNRESIFDGKWALTTNTNLPYKEIALYYKGLRQIEDGFRELKSEIEIGPMYHWVTRRIRAHVFICFLSLVLKIILKKKIKKINPEVNFSDVIKDMNAVKANIITSGEKKVVLRTDLQKFSHLAFRAVGLKIPGEIIDAKISPKITEKNQNLETTPLLELEYS